LKRTDSIEELTEIARKVRIRLLKMIHTAGSGHPGGSLSAVEILVSLYFSKMNHSPEYTKAQERDKFILSKGHAAPVLYTVLAKCGYFSMEELERLRKFESLLSGHPYAPTTPGVEVTTGSLGQGLSQANGIALAGRLNDFKSYVYCLMGDGETQEGQVWEAAMSAAHFKLGNMIAFLDNNELQIDGWVKDVMNIEPIDKKWEAFGWHVQKIDGHDFKSIFDAIEKAKAVTDKPSMIICRTVKGKGVSFMERLAKWHGTAPNAEELKKAIAELGGN
jgi:transketolase